MVELWRSTGMQEETLLAGESPQQVRLREAVEAFGEEFEPGQVIRASALAQWCGARDVGQVNIKFRCGLVRIVSPTDKRVTYGWQVPPGGEGEDQG